MDGDAVSVSSSRSRSAAGRITTGLWPGFPSDLVSLVTVLATQAEGRDARPRLAVRAAAVRARAVERHGRRSVPLRSAPHHRHRPAQAARTAARQPRPAIGNGADCRGARGRRAEPARRRSRPSSAATGGSSSGCRRSGRRSTRMSLMAGPATRDTPALAYGPPGVWTGAARAECIRPFGRRARAAAGRDAARRAAAAAARRSARAESRPTRNAPQIGFGQIEHADDVRRQREDDVGLIVDFGACARTAGRRPGVAQPGNAVERRGARRRGSGRRACWSRRRAAGSSC